MLPDKILFVPEQVSKKDARKLCKKINVAVFNKRSIFVVYENQTREIHTFYDTSVLINCHRIKNAILDRLQNCFDRTFVSNLFLF